MVAQRFLVPLVGVRIPTGLPLVRVSYYPAMFFRVNYRTDQTQVAMEALWEHQEIGSLLPPREEVLRKHLQGELHWQENFDYSRFVADRTDQSWAVEEGPQTDFPEQVEEVPQMDYQGR